VQIISSNGTEIDLKNYTKKNRTQNGLTVATIKWITHGACYLIMMHAATGDFIAVWHDLRNGPHHCLGNH